MSKAIAYRKVRTAISNGLLIRPHECQRCGAKPPPCSDGRAPIQAHHHDYSRPLDVEWICSKCHRAETPLPPYHGHKCIGTRNGYAKLTPELVRLIRISQLGCVTLARQLGVDKKTVLRVRRGELWSHVDSENSHEHK